MIDWMVRGLKESGYEVELYQDAKRHTTITVYWRGQRAYYNRCNTENTAIRKAYNYLMDKQSKAEIGNQAFLAKAEKIQQAAHAVLVEWGVKDA